MNELTFIQKHKLAWNKFRTAAGFPVIIDYRYIGTDKIVGFVSFNFDYDMPVEWDLNGKPLKLPLHYGLDIVPLKTVVSFEGIPVEERV